jgi:hypothetical protein
MPPPPCPPPTTALHTGFDLSGLVKDRTLAWSISQVLYTHLSGTPLAALVGAGAPTTAAAPATDPGTDAP